MSDTYFLIFGIICAVVGLLFLMAKMLSSIRCRVKTEAVITAVKVQSIVFRGATTHTYRPVFSYEANGKQLKAQAPFSSKKKDKYREGDIFPLFINPSKPEEYRFQGRVGALLAGVAFLAVGLLFVVVYFV